ncbi:hypothetical protein KXD93_05075 [Mucilaginibacter sp. BJC16-A38]|uniref:hypothetical protein n=1 Tax=Mucilaginibacter phenanthrenivorans TaxID=1234842 RepID=UPI0021572E74|nr:hypothetical protein [Mucilaginibacter phenanthrenivorans]MCR8557000.1 hypothetical protein [Mucilaginibacter phenanthrenivorans]
MRQVPRITVGKADYTFRILNPDPLRAGTGEIEVELDGKTLPLVRQGRSWICGEPACEGLEEIAEAIGKAIVLRYRN